MNPLLKWAKDNRQQLFLSLVVSAGIICYMHFMNTQPYKNNSIDNDDITMYSRDSCPYCRKMKKELNDKNVYDKINIIDVETENGQAKFKESNGDGVPYFESKSTGQTASGFMKFEHLLKELKLE